MAGARFGGLAGAWELAWQTRFCPPEELIRGESLTPEARVHLRSCPYCANLIDLMHESAPRPRNYPGGARPSARSEALALDVGQLWRLAPGLDGWGPKGRFYNSPVVLVLKAGSQVENGVLVAQTYHDPLLKGTDDVALGLRRFAQPWNVYTLHRHNLENCCGQLDLELAEQVLAASRAPFGHLDPTSALYLFRQMEIELGCYFSSTAVFALLEEQQGLARELGWGNARSVVSGTGTMEAGSELHETLATVPNLRADLLAQGLEIPAEMGQTKASDLYFYATPPVAELPLAASSAQAEWSVAVVAYDHQVGRPNTWELLEAQVTDYVGSPHLMVGGRFSTPLPEGGAWAAEFRWLDREDRLVSPQASRLTPGKESPPRFWVLFPTEETGAPRVGNRLRIRLFRATDRRP